MKRILLFFVLLAFLAFGALCALAGASEATARTGFAEEMARAQAGVSQSQAVAIEAQARAIEQQAEVNGLLTRAQLERERAQAFRAQVESYVLIVLVPAALALVAYIIHALRTLTAQAGKGAHR